MLSEFAAALDDDLNISGAWGAVFEWVRDTNRKLAENAMDAAAAAAALAAWDKLDSVLGVGAPKEVEVPAEITALVEARQAARKAKDFKRADAHSRRVEGQRLGHRGHAQRRAGQTLVT